MESLEEDLTCSVCYALFADPRVLPCSHTFCRACLDKVLQVSANFSIWRPLRIPLKCPNCRSVVDLPPPGVDGLPVNVSLRAIIEKFQCSSRPRPSICPEHPQQPLNVYCVRDRQLVCGFCLTVGQHQGHAIDDLHTAYTKERKMLGCLVRQLAEWRWADVSTLVEQLEEEKGRVESLLEQDREAVAHFFSGLEIALAHKKEAFMGALDRASAEMLRACEPLIDTLKDMKEEQAELMSYGADVEDEEAPLIFLEKVHELRCRVEALTKVSLPKVTTFCIHPRVSDFLAQQWSGVSVSNVDQGPVPHITCCTKGCCSREGAAHTWLHLRALCPSTLSVILTLLLLSLLGLSYHVPAIPTLHQLMQAFAQGVGGRGTDAVLSLHSMLPDPILRCWLFVSSLGETTSSYLGSVCKMF